MLRFHLQPTGRSLSCPTYTWCVALGAPALLEDFLVDSPRWAGSTDFLSPEPCVILNMKAQGFPGWAEPLSTGLFVGT